MQFGRRHQHGREEEKIRSEKIRSEQLYTLVKTHASNSISMNILMRENPSKTLASHLIVETINSNAFIFRNCKMISVIFLDFSFPVCHVIS